MILQIFLGLTGLVVILVVRKLSSCKLSSSIPGRGPIGALFNIKSLRKDITHAVNVQKAKWFRWAIVGQEALIATHPDTLKVI